MIVSESESEGESDNESESEGERDNESESEGESDNDNESESESENDNESESQTVGDSPDQGLKGSSEVIVDNLQVKPVAIQELYPLAGLKLCWIWRHEHSHLKHKQKYLEHNQTYLNTCWEQNR